MRNEAVNTAVEYIRTPDRYLLILIYVQAVFALRASSPPGDEAPFNSNTSVAAVHSRYA